MTQDTALSRQETWAEVLEVLGRSQRVVLTTHVQSDGDGLGCELALARALKRAHGTDVTIVNPTPTQERYGFLYAAGEVRDYEPSLDDVIAEADCIVVLDINRYDRLGEMAAPVRRAPGIKLCIDHHPVQEPFGDVAVVDSAASATGVLIHDLVLALLGELPDEAVEPLYVAIMTDTGSFRFANTNARAFEIATALVARGARPDVLYRYVYETSSPGRMKLLGYVLSNLEYGAGGELVHFTISSQVLASCGVEREEAEGFTDVVRSVDGSVAVLSFLELPDGGAKVSLRSKGTRLDVGRIAQRFGGGGHANASGIVDPRPLAEARAEILDAVARELG